MIIVAGAFGASEGAATDRFVCVECRRDAASIAR
jgi:hypothetical protein